MVTEATAAIPRRIEFETTLDDYVDANIRMAGRTKTFRRQRAVYRWFTGIVSGAPLIAPAVLSELLRVRRDGDVDRRRRRCVVRRARRFYLRTLSRLAYSPPLSQSVRRSAEGRLGDAFRARAPAGMGVDAVQGTSRPGSQPASVESRSGFEQLLPAIRVSQCDEAPAGRRFDQRVFRLRVATEPDAGPGLGTRD